MHGGKASLELWGERSSPGLEREQFVARPEGASDVSRHGVSQAGRPPVHKVGRGMSLIGN